MRKQKKKEKFEISLPKSKLKETVFVSPSSSGYVLGMAGSDQHITVVDEGKYVSSHRTFQGKGKSQHIGRTHLSDIGEKFWIDVLKIRELPQDKLDETVFYLTKKWRPFLDMPEEVIFKKKVGKKEIVSHLDLEEIFKRAFVFIQQLRSAPEEFMGLCPARKILTSRKMALGLMNNGTAVMKLDHALYEIDLSAFLELFSGQGNHVPNSPLINALQGFGITALMSDFLQRVKRINEGSGTTG